MYASLRFEFPHLLEISANVISDNSSFTPFFNMISNFELKLIEKMHLIQLFFRVVGKLRHSLILLKCSN